MVTIRFYGSLIPLNEPPKEWDFTRSFSSDEEAGEAIQDYLCCNDDDFAHYEVVEEPCSSSH